MASPSLRHRVALDVLSMDLKRSRDSIVNIGIWVQAGRSGVCISLGARFFCFPKRPAWCWDEVSF